MLNLPKDSFYILHDVIIFFWRQNEGWSQNKTIMVYFQVKMIK